MNAGVRERKRKRLDEAQQQDVKVNEEIQTTVACENEAMVSSSLLSRKCGYVGRHHTTVEYRPRYFQRTNALQFAHSHQHSHNQTRS